MACKWSKNVQQVKSQANTEQHNREHRLESAFTEFNAHADQLSATFQDLNRQVQSLTAELADERSKRQQQLAENERYASRLSHLLSALPAGIVVLDMRGRIEESNPAAVDLLGEPLDGELWRDIISRVFEPGSQAGQEARLTDGRTVSISTCPRGDEPGQIILLMDVTETRFLQQALSRHQRLSAMGEMSAKLAHQIRTPLASALLYTSNLSKTKLKVAEREKFVSKTLSRLQHLENVVEDMLSFSRVGELGQDLISLSDLLDELHQAMETHLDADECELEMKMVNPELFLSANRDALLGVLQNLMTNAIQACGKKGQLSLSVKPVDQVHGIASIDICLSDNGPGISNDVIENIFDPFFTTRASGTGLGLAVAKAVIENHAGSIWVDSSNANGTTFVIRLPIAKNNTTNF